MELLRQIGDRWGLANALNNLGNAARTLGDYDRFQALYAESMTLTRTGRPLGAGLSAGRHG
ncbi:MAG: hypothetical protein R3A10_13650 [Caldilineaceae bacterium]